jgi:hypothetical protein
MQALQICVRLSTPVSGYAWRRGHVFIRPSIVVPFGPYWGPYYWGPYPYPPVVVTPPPQVYVQPAPQTPRCPFHKFAASQAAVRVYGLGG